MKPERYQQIEELYHAALERAPEERTAYLKQACNGDQALCEEVESLLAYDAQAEQFIETPPDDLAAGLLDANLQKSPMVGHTVGHYRMLSLLGAGGMGEVYLAEDTRLKRRVAIKLLPQDLTNNADRLRRFKQEARATSALNHPNILTLHEIGETDGKHYIATEYVEGETLRHHVQHSRMRLRDLLDTLVQVASALSAAHQAGIIHRDLKPENLMLRPDGIVKVLDFGLAKLSEKLLPTTDSLATTLSKKATDPGTIMGTVQYMSPEQARGQQVDARSDIFSFGIMMYEMIAGRLPFVGESSADVLVAILDKEPLPLAQLVDGIPTELQRIVSKCLCKSREERYQTMKEVMLELRELRDELALEAKLERSIRPTNKAFENQQTLIADSNRTKDQTAHVTGMAIPQTTLSEGGLGSQLRRHKGGLAIGLVILLSLAGFGIYRFLGLSKTGPGAFFERVKITKLTKSGKVTVTAISPDGKYFAHVMSDGIRQTILVRQTASNNDIVVVPTAAAEYWGITFSKDNNDLFYVAREVNGPGVLYRIPALGGTPQRLLESVDCPVTFSPDGKELAFVRADFPSRSESALITANADGTGERVVAIRKIPERFYPIYFTGPSWSPDGTTLAATVAGVGSLTNFKVIGFNVRDGKETDLTKSWGFIGRVEWLPDGKGLMMIAREQEASFIQVWQVSIPSGEARQISNVLNDHRGLSLTADASKLVTGWIDRLSGVWVAPLSDINQIRQITPPDSEGALGISWSPDGKLVYFTDTFENSNLWIMKADGSGQKQLTANAKGNFYPKVSPDGKLLAFVSNRTATRTIWSSNIDGSNQRQLTNNPGDSDPTFSVDGRWIIYAAYPSHSYSYPDSYSYPATRGLWKVSIDGGNPILLSEGSYAFPAVSPDGKLMAAMYLENRTMPDQQYDKIAIIPIEGGAPVKTFAIQNSPTTPTRPIWTADGKNLIYNQVKDNIGNLWLQPLAGGSPKQISNFRDSFVYDFALSPDGKQIAISRGNYTRDAIMLSNDK